MPTGLVSGKKSFPSCLLFVTLASIFSVNVDRERERGARYGYGLGKRQLTMEEIA